MTPIPWYTRAFRAIWWRVTSNRHVCEECKYVNPPSLGYGASNCRLRVKTIQIGKESWTFIQPCGYLNPQGYCAYFMSKAYNQ